MDVICYSGSEYAEAPRALLLDGQRLEVAQVLASWRTPQGKGFRVQAAGGAAYDLFYLAAEDRWQVTPIHPAHSTPPPHSSA
jgi:hypothetical protein